MTEYLSTTENKNEKVKRKLRVVKEKKETNEEEFRILKMEEHDMILTKKYKTNELKEMCVFYKLKKSGNKNELIQRIHYYLKHSLYAIKIQKIARGNILRNYIKTTGPAFKLKDRSKCVNDTDFATLEPIKEIPYNQFFSFEDDEKTVYGFDVSSFYNLLYNRTQYDIYYKKDILNPYNRKPIDIEILNIFKRSISMAKKLKIEQTTQITSAELNSKKELEMKIIGLFQEINELGNYADSNWFSNLSKFLLVVFIREMYDIRHYRAQLTPILMRTIVPPHGNPFIEMNFQVVQSQSEEQLRRQAVRIMEYLIKSSNQRDNRSLGAYYILAALTLVSEDARTALPWLYQSVSHHH